MQKREGRLKYTIAAVATAAILVATPFLFRKCMKEDIQKSIELQKTHITENKEHGKKQAIEKLAKMVNGITPLEEKNVEIIDGVEIVDDEEGTVKKIIAEYPHESIKCKKIPAKEVREKQENLKEFEETTEDTIGELIEKLGKEGKVDQLLSVLKHYESLGAHYDFTGEGDMVGIFHDYTQLNQKMWYSDEKEEAEYYDPECVSHLFRLEMRIPDVLGQLSEIWVKKEYEPMGLIEAVPELYKEKVTLWFVGRMMEDPEFSVEKFERMLYRFPEEYKEDAIRRIHVHLDEENEEPEKRIKKVMEQTENNELKEKLNEILKEWEIEKKKWEELEKEYEEDPDFEE